MLAGGATLNIVANEIKYNAEVVKEYTGDTPAALNYARKLAAAMPDAGTWKTM